MGTRGPQRKPDYLRVLEGNAGKVPLGRGLSVPPQREIEEPQHFDEEQLAVWKDVTRTLSLVNGLVAVDRFTLERYCSLLCLYRKAEKWMKESSKGLVAYSITVKDPDDPSGKKEKLKNARPLPQLKIMLEISNHLLRIEQQFGFTPAARASWGNGSGNGGTSADDGDEFLD